LGSHQLLKEGASFQFFPKIEDLSVISGKRSEEKILQEKLHDNFFLLPSASI